MLDTQLLVLLVVGRINITAIGSHHRLRAYRSEDYRLLRAILDGFSLVSTTPSVLTEASNLLRQKDGRHRVEFSDTLRIFAMEATEQYVPSRAICDSDAYPSLGLTDAGLIEICRDGPSLLTADFALFGRAQKAGCTAINFHHLRAQAQGM